RARLPRRRERSMSADPVGLCRDCRHSRTVATTRSTFWLCQRSKADPSFPRYPRLPVLVCPGYEPRAPDRGNTPGPANPASPPPGWGGGGGGPPAPPPRRGLGGGLSPAPRPPPPPPPGGGGGGGGRPPPQGLRRREPPRPPLPLPLSHGERESRRCPPLG